MNTRYSNDQHAMDYGDEIAYEAGTLMVDLPVPIELPFCVANYSVFTVGNQVWHEPSGAMATIKRITFMDRCGGYYQIHYSTERLDYLNDDATKFTPMANNRVNSEIPC